MTIYAPSDVRSILIPAERGGCGVPHEAGDLPPGEHHSVTCPQCEPHIAAMRTGWAHTLAGVHLIPDEIADAEAAEAAAARAQNRTWGDPNALGKAFREALGPAVTPAVPSLLEQIAALGAHERAALAAMLAADTPSHVDNGGSSAAVNTVPGPGQVEPESPDVPGDAEARKPSRPRKTPPTA